MGKTKQLCCYSWYDDDMLVHLPDAADALAQHATSPIIQRRGTTDAGSREPFAYVILSIFCVCGRS